MHRDTEVLTEGNQFRLKINIHVISSHLGALTSTASGIFLLFLLQTHAIGQSVLKTTHADGDSTAGTLQVKLLAEKTQFGIKSGVQMPAFMEIKMQRSYPGSKGWNMLLK